MGLVIGLGLLGAVAAGVSGTGSATTPSVPPTVAATSVAATPTPTAQPSTSGTAEGPALAALEGLEVKGRAPKTGYDRDLFGQKWADVDRNGCDTRNDVLRRDLDEARTTPGSNGCAVAVGTLKDPYTGSTMKFVRGADSARAIHIDHVVALSDAWQKGAQQWDVERRTNFANDPLNLLAVQGVANMQKGDGDAATWLPPNKKYRCDYVARQVAVKARYGLWVTRVEHDVIRDILRRCPGQEIVTAADPPRTENSIDAAGPDPATPAATPDPPGPADTHGEEGVYYRNCAAARDAGAAPLLRGEPGYRPGLDGDDDGVACE